MNNQAAVYAAEAAAAAAANDAQGPQQVKELNQVRDATLSVTHL